MIPGSFDYHRPGSIEEAAALLGRLGEDAKVLAGGHSLLPMMKLRLAEPKSLIDLGAIGELRAIREKDGVLHIGAMVTEAALIASDLIRRKCPLIAEAAASIADPQVRNRGTIGGDIAHGDPGNDHPAIMLALGASFVLRGAKGERVVAADGFYRALFETALKPDEILVEIRVPAMRPGTGASYQKLKRKVGDFAIAGAAAVIGLKDGSCDHAAIALTNVGPTALVAKEAASALVGKAIDEALIGEAARLAMSACAPAADLRGPVEYKIRMAGEMTRRAVREALKRAKGG
jgi:carbon-monoxide dehydrogenase medium subunit